MAENQTIFPDCWSFLFALNTIFLVGLLYKDFPKEITPDVKSALRMRFCMDKDTLEECLIELRRTEEKTGLIAIAIDNLETQLKINHGGQLILTIIGYLCLGIEKYFTPNSSVTAGINFIMSSAWWTLRVYAETFKEIGQRSRMNQLRPSIFLEM